MILFIYVESGRGRFYCILLYGSFARIMFWALKRKSNTFLSFPVLLVSVRKIINGIVKDTSDENCRFHHLREHPPPPSPPGGCIPHILPCHRRTKRDPVTICATHSWHSVSRSIQPKRKAHHSPGDNLQEDGNALYAMVDMPGVPKQSLNSTLTTTMTPHQRPPDPP